MLYRSGRFAEAAAKFQAIVKANPKNVPAQMGLIHALLRAEKIDDAQAAAISALAVAAQFFPASDGHGRCAVPPWRNARGGTSRI